MYPIGTKLTWSSDETDKADRFAVKLFKALRSEVRLLCFALLLRRECECVCIAFVVCSANTDIALHAGACSSSENAFS